jgi:hypothetical protein
MLTVKMHLDHVFCFVDPHFLQESSVVNAGFTIAGPTGRPLGIGLRGPLSSDQRAEFFAYDLAEQAGRLWIHRACNETAELPLLFVIERDEGIAPQPLTERGYTEHLFVHENGAHEIERVTVRGSTVAAMPRFATIPPIDLEPGPHWQMTVEIESDVDDLVEVVPSLQLKLGKNAGFWPIPKLATPLRADAAARPATFTGRTAPRRS